MNRRYPKQFRMYIAADDEVTFQKFKEVVKREGRSMAKVVAELVAEYVRRHEAGNPQLRLDRILQPATYICSLCKKPASQLWKVRFLSGLTAWTCSECIKAKREKGLVKKILGLV